jgi:hypothetical protein
LPRDPANPSAQKQKTHDLFYFCRTPDPAKVTVMLGETGLPLEVVPLGASNRNPDRHTQRAEGYRHGFRHVADAADSKIDGTLSPALIAALNGCSFAAFARTLPWSCVIEQSKHGLHQALQQLAVGPGTREHANPK